MSRSRRQRSVIVMLLTVCLLLQQVAMTALACAMPLLPVAAVSMPVSAMSPECRAAMASEPRTDAADGLCEKYCAPDATSASTTSIPPVPALALPPLLHAVAVLPVTHRRDIGSGDVFARSDPPTHLHYSRLLI